jgi:hypothetical protein
MKYVLENILNEVVVAKSSHCLGICRAELWEIAENMKTSSVLAEIRTEYFQNTGLKMFHYTNPLCFGS